MTSPSYHVFFSADSPRLVVLRNKPSTGQWFLNTHSLMVQVRKPKSKDVWA